MNEMKVAIAAAKAAGELSLKLKSAGLAIEAKKDGSPVTNADKLCEEKIISIIRKTFPNDSILGEESGLSLGGNKERKWIIDPIDGTKYFIRGLPFFCTLVALEENGKIICGAAYFPMFKRLNYAQRKGGAFLNGKRMHVSRISTLEKALVCYSQISKFRNTAGILKLLKMTDTAISVPTPYAIMLAAEGKADAAITATGAPWDLAVIRVVVEEAGGRFTDFSGKDTIYGGNGVVSNGLLHDSILRELDFK